MTLLERYLCVDGVEVANGCRTLAYLRALGNPCLPTAPSLCDCCCLERPDCAERIFTVNDEQPTETELGYPVWSIRRNAFYDEPGYLAWSCYWRREDGTDPIAGVSLASIVAVEVDCDATVEEGLVAILSGDGEPVIAPETEILPVAPGEVLVIRFPDPATTCQVYLLTWATPWGDVETYIFAGLTGIYPTIVVGPPIEAPPYLNPYGDPAELGFMLDPPAYGTSTLSEGADGDCGPFTTPAADDAPWYDPLVPASADVLGVWIEEARISSGHSRTMRDKVWGGAAGPQRVGSRELSIVGYVYTRTAAATAYARQWLYEALSGGACGGPGVCELPSAEIMTYCDSADPTAGLRTLKRVALTGWDPNAGDHPPMCGFEFEATLSSEVGYLYPPPFEPIELEPMSGDERCAICQDCPERAADPCACGALAQPTRVVPEPEPTGFYCPAPVVRRACADLATPFAWIDATTIIEIENTVGPSPALPDGGVRNLRIRAWPNPVGLPLPDEGDEPVDYFECQEPCIDIEVACIPANATLVIDGTTRDAYVLCGGVRQPGYAYLSSGGGGRLVWPDISCDGLAFCVDADAYGTPADLLVRATVVPRERG